MARPLPPPGAGGARPAEDRPHGDPWQAFGYIVAGVLFYGAIGYGLDRWLETSFLVVLGILAGAGLGIYMTFKRFDTSAGAGPGATTDARQETR